MSASARTDCLTAMDGDLALLTGSEAGRLLAAAVGAAGGELVGWRAGHVDHRPGRSTTAVYRTTVRWADGVRHETLAASAGSGPAFPGDAAPPPGAVVVGDGDREVAVWRFPADPDLPALAVACDPAAVARLLRSLAVPGVDDDGRAVTLRTRAYRPRRRAVVEVTAPGARVFLKVVRPSAVADLHRRHRMLHDAGVPVPRSLGWGDDGVLVLEALAGTPMRRAIRHGGALPDGDDLMDLLAALPPEVTDLPARRAWAENAAHYAAVIGSVLPAEADRAAHVAAAVAEGTAGLVPDAPTHGDFYEGQMLLGPRSGGARVTGLLDVDTAGPGRRADDVACLLAHLEVLALVDGFDADRLAGVSRGWQESAERLVDPAEVRLRTAGVLLSLATGPHRVQEDGWQRATAVRLDVAERWVASAGRAR
jgi:hypothetical protein